MLYLVKTHNGEARVFLSAEEANQEALNTTGGEFLEVDASVKAVKAVKVESKAKEAVADVSDEVAALLKEVAALKAAKAETK